MTNAALYFKALHCQRKNSCGRVMGGMDADDTTTVNFAKPIFSQILIKHCDSKNL